MMDLDPWGQFTLTLVGGASTGYLGGVLSFARRIRKAEDRVLKLELAVGTEKDGGGLYGRVEDIKDKLTAMDEKADKQHEFLRTRIHEWNQTIMDKMADVEKEREERARALLEAAQLEIAAASVAKAKRR